MPGDEDIVLLYEAKVVRWRRHQDDKTIYRDWQLPARQTIGMTGAARDRLYEYNIEMMTVTDSLMEDGRRGGARRRRAGCGDGGPGGRGFCGVGGMANGGRPEWRNADSGSIRHC